MLNYFKHCDAGVDAGHVKSLHKRRDERANKHTDSATVNCVGTGNTALNFLWLLMFVFVRTLFIDSDLDSLQAFPDAEGATHVQEVYFGRLGISGNEWKVSLHQHSRVCCSIPTGMNRSGKEKRPLFQRPWNQFDSLSCVSVRCKLLTPLFCSLYGRCGRS